MRERRPGDWRVDLARRHPLETTVETALDNHPELTRLSSSTTSLDRLDFQLIGPGERLCELELKAKHQRYVGWTDLARHIAEPDLFIVDELALRKIIGAGRYAFMLVRDDPNGRWVLWTLMDLVLAPKTRANRQLATSNGGNKGKILLDLTDTPHHHHALPDALDRLTQLVHTTDNHWNAIDAWPTRDHLALVDQAPKQQRAQLGSRVPTRKDNSEQHLALEHR